ncbi:MAG: hypothetical protein ACI87N_003737, partial [Flavobacteriales bacterium]
GASFDFPALDLGPVEGGHTGNKVSAVLSKVAKIPQDAPANWNTNNGVPWATAATEVLAAEAASHTKIADSGRFSHIVGEKTFKPG